MKTDKLGLLPPCTYQGGKQRLSKQIVDIIFEQNDIKEDTKFYDLCCGSGAITLELINRGISPSNITMVDKGVFGAFWERVAKDEFELELFYKEVDNLPDTKDIQNYLKELSNNEVNFKLLEYHYLLLQSGSFGSKQIWVEGNKWKNNSFRSYWLPTQTSKRKSPVNPMMPMPKTLYKRVEDIVNVLGGKINALQRDIMTISWNFNKDTIVYIDPPYSNTTGYGYGLDYEDFIKEYKEKTNLYVSEGVVLKDATSSILLSSGRKKGNISGNTNKKPIQEWLNSYMCV